MTEVVQLGEGFWKILKLLPVLKWATRKLERDFGQEYGMTGQGGMALK